MPILRSEVLRRMQATLELPKDALHALIDLELQAAEARRRGLTRHPDVVQAAKRTAVYRLLAMTFEKEYTRDSVGEKLLRRMYKMNIRKFVRPPLRRFSHILVKLPWRKQGEKLVIYREEIENARKLAHELVSTARDRLARGPLTWKQFEALAETVRNRGFAVVAERGVKAERDLRPSFAKVLFSMERPGTVSDVVKTRYGFHVIFLIEIIPPKNVGYEQARPEVLDRIYPEVRARAFRRWVDRLKERCPVESFPEHIPISGAHGPSCIPKTRQPAGRDHGL